MISMEQKNSKLIKKDEVADISIFKNISRYSSAFKSVLRRCTRRTYNPSSTICEEGSVVDGVYLIEEGEVTFEDRKLSSHKTSPTQINIQPDIPHTHNKSQRGEIIGEGDVKELRRTFNARARTKTKLILIPNEIYQFLTQKIAGDISQEHNIPLFNNLSTASIQQLYEHSIKKRYGIRNVVYSFGDEATSVYMIVSGEFRVQQRLKNILYTVNNGSFFGFQDIINETNRVHKVTCASAQGMLIEFRRDIFESYCLSNPQTCQQFKQVMEQRLSAVRKEKRKARLSENLCYYPENLLGELNMAEEKKNILRSNKVFKTIDKEYKMVNTLKKFQKKEKQNNVRKGEIPQPWFRNNDKKIIMKIRQMESKAGIWSCGKDARRAETQHSVTRRFLKQLNYDPHTFNF